MLARTAQRRIRIGRPQQLDHFPGSGGKHEAVCCVMIKHIRNRRHSRGFKRIGRSARGNQLADRLQIGAFDSAVKRFSLLGEFTIHLH